jgi:RND superfamily putative drug exporter
VSIALYRLGRFAFARPWRVLLAWVLLVGVVVGLLATQPHKISTGLTLQGTASQATLDEVSAQLPGAGGTQGTIIVTARDGGRVDTPERMAAIADAMARQSRTGQVVDREEKLAAQRQDVRDRITERIEPTVAADLGPRLASLAASLDSAASRLGNTTISGLAQRAWNVSSAAPHDMIQGASTIFAELAELQKNAGASGLSPQALGLPTPEGGASDPVAAVREAVDRASAPILADLDRLTTGTTPQGGPLTVDGRTFETIRVSDDGTVAMMPVLFAGTLSELPGQALEDVLIVTDDAIKGVGLVASPSPSLLPTEPPLGGHEAIGLGIALVVLLLTLGSLVAAGLPLLTALVGVFLGVGGAFALSANFLMTTSTPALGLMLGLAVGIDYALFIVHKHRALMLREGLPAQEAVGRALGTAGSAVLFAGLTVITALLGLLTLGIEFVNTMALTAAATVTLAVAISLTALPALLGLVGERIVRRSARRVRPASGHHPVARRWVGAVTARPILTIAAVVLVLGVPALGATNLRLGMPDGGVAKAGSAQRVNYDATARAFGEGANAPLVVAVRNADRSPLGTPQLLERQGQLAAIEGVRSARLMGVSPDRSLAVFQTIPAAGPNDPSTEDLVHRLRGTDLPGALSLGVTGLTAINIDLSEVLAAAIPIYLGVVVALSLIILLLVFRSLLVPLAATAGFLLAIAATMGLVVAAFGDERWTWLVGVDRAGPILSFLPVMATGLLYGLAMDYQVFLGASMREDYVHGKDARAAVKTGFHHASRVVVAAAVIMISVFGGFILGDDTTIRQFGFALSAGILIDAFLIRMTLMPALLSLAGERAWWLPRWLDRLLPTVDIEGDSLRRRLTEAA